MTYVRGVHEGVSYPTLAFQFDTFSARDNALHFSIINIKNSTLRKNN